VPKAERIFTAAIDDIARGAYPLDLNKIMCRPPAESETAALRRQLDRLNAKLRRQREAYEGGVDSLEEYRRNKSETSREIGELETRIAARASDGLTIAAVAAALQAKADGLAALVLSDELTVAQKNTALRELIHHAVYNQDTDIMELFFVL
jgi:hypothetical protein